TQSSSTTCGCILRNSVSSPSLTRFLGGRGYIQKKQIHARRTIRSFLSLENAKPCKPRLQLARCRATTCKTLAGISCTPRCFLPLGSRKDSFRNLDLCSHSSP